MASVTFTHARDHAVVAFTGELDWDAVRELVETIDLVVDEFFYTVVEVVVSSRGGNTRAFEFYLAQQERWRGRGLRLRTRILSEAASAAAILVSLGDERVAEPGATLSLHCAHVSPESQLNAQASASIFSVLNEIDDRMIARLVERVARSRDEVPHEAERADRSLLERLWAEFARTAKRRQPPRKVRGLARGIGRYVEQAVRRSDRDALTRLYRRLFEIECTLSARLALTVRLIDRIGPCAPRVSRVSATPGLTVPQWRGLFPPSGEVPRALLTRHVLATGETGSGKTASCILPVAAAMARAPRERLAAALIIDPKRELEPVLEALAPERLRHLLVEGIVLDVMSGPRWSLVHDRTARRWVSAARRILCRVASLVPSSPAKVLLPHVISNDNTEFFNREGTARSPQTVLAFILLVTDPPTRARAEVNGSTTMSTPTCGWRSSSSAPEGPKGRARSQCPRARRLGPQRTARIEPPEQRSHLASASDRPLDDQWLFADSHARSSRTSARSRARRAICCAASPTTGRRWREAASAVSPACARPRAPRARTSPHPPSSATLYFGCEPGLPRRRRENGLDFAPLVSRDGPGALVLCPTRARRARQPGRRRPQGHCSSRPCSTTPTARAAGSRTCRSSVTSPTSSTVS